MNVSCLPLLQRIHKQRLKDARKEKLKYILKEWCFLFVFFLILMLFQSPNRVYNAWNGPFTMDAHQLLNYLDINYHSFGYKFYFSFHWLSFRPEYLQIEFGETLATFQLDKPIRYTSDLLGYGRVIDIYTRVIESIISVRYSRLYLKFSSYELPKHAVYHLYQFQSLSITTLRCIVKQLAISPLESSTWYERSMYIREIEKQYHENTQLFTTIFMSNCGVIVGYFTKTDKTDDDVRLLDTSCHYTPHISYLFVGLFIYCLLKNFHRIIQLLMHVLNSSLPNQDLLAMKQLSKSDIISLEDLDNLLLKTTYQNNYHDSLFILRQKYLFMFIIDSNEKSSRILTQYYEKAPFLIIPLDTITEVKSFCFVINDIYVSFPSYVDSYYSTASDWLHRRLMSLSKKYRYRYELNQVFEREQERQRHFTFLVIEETQYQQQMYSNDISRILQRIPSASPEFIAEFRLNNPQIATNEMLLETCSVCLENFQSNRRCGQWPCPGRHVFHFDCMLDVLRTGNKCPLCRHSVEPANLPGIDNFFSLLAQQTMTALFT